jgi:RHS repeat-associated protein
LTKRANGILKDDVFWITTFYVYDATGNVMAVYERSYQALSQFNLYKESVRLIEQHIYGSDRIGLRKCNVLVYEDVFSISAIDSNTHEFMDKAKPVLSGGDGTGNGGRGPVASPAVHVIVGSNNHLAEQYQRTLGDKRYKLKNHLGNVLIVITDRKIAVDNVSYVSGNGMHIPAPSSNQLFLLTVTGTFVQVAAADLKVDYYMAEIVKSTEYSCYGVELAGWGYISVESFRYGYNGKEKNDEIYGEANCIDYGERIYDPRLGRWSAVEPLSANFPMHSTYAYAANSPILFVDYDGRYFGIDDGVAALIGGIVNLGVALYKGDVKNFGQGLAYLGAGAAVGTLSLYPQCGGWAIGGAIVSGTDAAITEYNEKGYVTFGNVASKSLGGAIAGQLGGWALAKTMPAAGRWLGAQTRSIVTYFGKNSSGKIASIIVRLAAPNEFTILNRVENIMQSQAIKKAIRRGVDADVEVDGVTIMIRPDAPFSGFTNFADDSFIIGKDAIDGGSMELVKTYLQEVYRLTNSFLLRKSNAGTLTPDDVVSMGYNSAQEGMSAETNEAATFADEAYEFYFKK